MLTGCLGIEPGTDMHQFSCAVCDTLGDPIRGIELSVDSRTLAAWDKPGTILSEITSASGKIEYSFAEITESKVYIFTARDINPLEYGAYKDRSDTLIMYFNAGSELSLNLTFCLENAE